MLSILMCVVEAYHGVYIITISLYKRYSMRQHLEMARNPLNNPTRRMPNRSYESISNERLPSWYPSAHTKELNPILHNFPLFISFELNVFFLLAISQLETM